MFKAPEEHRNNAIQGLMSSMEDGNNGFFVFPYKGYEIRCVAGEGYGWEYVSVTINRKRTPDWDTMCKVKDLFWDESDIVIQYHPAKEDYVNEHPNCLHLWRPIGIEFPKPPTIMVGKKTG